MDAMAQPKTSSKWVSIPNSVLHTDQLSLIAKVLFVEISSLDDGFGCFATNKYFGAFLNIHPRRVTDHLASLKTNGFITMKLKNQNQRIIRVAKKFARRVEDGGKF